MSETIRSEASGAGEGVAPGERRTDVESWLLDLGLNAIQVAHCPIEVCEACHAPQRAQAA